MGWLKKVEKKLRPVAKIAAVAAAVYFTGGAALAAYGQYAAAKARAAQQQAPGYTGAEPIYSAPFNPGYSYTGPPDFTGAGGQVYGGGGAAIPIMQQSGESSAPGFSISPIMAMAGIGIIALIFGMFVLRR